MDVDVARDGTSWSPGIDVSDLVLGGPSAYDCYVLIERGAWTGGGLLATMMVGMAALDVGWADHPVLIVLVLLLLVDALVFLPVVVGWQLRQRRREIREGYTSLLGEHPEVQQVDARSLQVVRLVGEDLLTYEEYLERVRAVRGMAQTAGRSGGERE